MRRLATVGVLALTLALGGCALFSEARNKQGEELTQAWAKVDVAAPIAAARKNRTTLLAEQLKIEDELWGYSRTRIAEQMLQTWRVADFRAHVENRIKTLAGSKDQLKAFADTKTNVSTARDQLALKQADFRLLGVTFPGCDAVAPGPARTKFEKGITDPPKAALVRVLLDGAQAPCAQLANAKQGFAVGGELGQAQTALNKARVEQKSADDKVEVAQDEFNAAKKEHEDAAKALVAKPESSSDAVTKSTLNNARTRAVACFPGECRWCELQD